MKIRALSRSTEAYTRECKGDVLKTFHNTDPSLHPFDKAREYTRAIQATKLDRMFAKPFIGALDGHTDAVSVMSTTKPITGSSGFASNVVQFLSGSCDGELRCWDLDHKKCVWKAVGHTGFVRGLSILPDGVSFLSCGDQTVKQWKLEIQGNIHSVSDLETKKEAKEQPTPMNTWFNGEEGYNFTSIDTNWSCASSQFATSTDSLVQLWDVQRSSPLSSLDWGFDTITKVKYNPADSTLLAALGNDRGLTLIDTREKKNMRKLILAMKSNSLAWNPQEPLNFVVANEDHCLYTYDMRKLNTAKMVHKDHVDPVLDVAFSPTGQEFVSGSYDKTVRIWNVKSGRSREVYHGRRMQRVNAVCFSNDATFVISGSTDTNIRIWKAEASKTLGVKARRTERKLEYQEALKERYQHMPEIRRIAKHRHLPTLIKKLKRKEIIQKDSARRKLGNRNRHRRKGSAEEKPEPERKRNIMSELK